MLRLQAGGYRLHGRGGEHGREPQQRCRVSPGAEQDHPEPAGAAGETEGSDRRSAAPGDESLHGKRVSKG